MLGGYALGIAGLILVAGGAEPARFRLAGLHLALAALVLALAYLDHGADRNGLHWLRRWLPVIALPWLYDAAGRLRHLLVGRDLDAWIAGADARLFPGRWYLAGAHWPLPALELAHAVYFSYYILLFVPALAADRRQQPQVDRYLRALTGTLLAHYALNFLLPVAGPLVERAGGMPGGILFLPLMNAIYFAFDRGGLAFPSTHVAAAVVAGWFAGHRFFPSAAPGYAFWVAAIAASTVVCGYHYPIDALAGLVTGSAGLAIALRVERRTSALPPSG